jgi:alpha-galactosidase
MKTLTLAGIFWISMVGVLPAQIISPDTNLTVREEQIVAASKIQAAPRFNGACVFGIYPRTPFLQSRAVSGERPMVFSATGLPHGLKLDSETGILAGSLKKAGEYQFKVSAKNSAGTANAEIKIVSGKTLALTPPMGWNSYDAFGDSVRESEVLSNALWLKQNFQSFGWNTIVVDFRWYDSLADGIRPQNPEGVTIDRFGRCIPPVDRFPSAASGAGFKNLAKKIHAMGLQFGIHIMRGIPRKAVEENLPIADSKFTAMQAVLPVVDPNRECVWNHDMFGVDATTAAGKAWDASITKQYADWGVDYIKCDDISNLQRGKFYDASEIETLSEALKGSGRSIVLSLSPGATPLNAAPHVQTFANLWRISPDFWDNWPSLDRNFTLFAAWFGNGGPGHWPDGDMIPFGHLCQRNCDVKPDRWTRFTRDEQLTLLSLWALAPSPLMLGMNLPDNDDWTTAILSNPEVIAVDQDSLGKEARRRFGPPQVAETWMKELSDGSFAVGFFNRTEKTASVNLPWRNLGFLSPPMVHDLWLQKDLGRQENFVADLPPHGCVLLKVK